MGAWPLNSEHEALSITLGVIWLVTMAVLYQVERSVEKRLMAIALAEAMKKPPR